MGSVPIHMPKLLIVSALVELLSFGGTLLVEFDSEFLLLTIGFIYFFLMLARYRNKGARHTYEIETKRSMFNMSVIDELVERKKRLSNSTMSGANNTTIRGMSKGAVFEDAVKKAVDKKMPGITDKFNK